MAILSHHLFFCCHFLHSACVQPPQRRKNHFVRVNLFQEHEVNTVSKTQKLIPKKQKVVN